jgi:hypothetical protein
MPVAGGPEFFEYWRPESSKAEKDTMLVVTHLMRVRCAALCATYRYTIMEVIIGEKGANKTLSEPRVL